MLNRFVRPTPKTNLNELEQALLIDNQAIGQCQNFAKGKQPVVVDSKGIRGFSELIPKMFCWWKHLPMKA